MINDEWKVEANSKREIKEESKRNGDRESRRELWKGRQGREGEREEWRRIMDEKKIGKR